MTVPAPRHFDNWRCVKPPFACGEGLA